MYPVIAMHALLTSSVLMTSDAVAPVTKFKFYKAAAEDIIGQEATVRARSAIHCAILCRRNPYCVTSAFDAERSLCFLHPKTMTDSAHTGELQNNGTRRLPVLTDKNPDCSENSINVTCESVAIRRTLWSVEGNITCNNDFYPILVPFPVTCLSNGTWIPSSPRCQKRIWRYPETPMASSDVNYPIPGTVVEGWSLCVTGIPTAKSIFIINIYNGSNANVPIHTSWRLSDNFLVVNDKIAGLWSQQTTVRAPPLSLMVGKPFFFKITLNTSTTADIFMDNTLFFTLGLKLPPSSFSLISVSGDVNVTKVEAWCND